MFSCIPNTTITIIIIIIIIIMASRAWGEARAKLPAHLQAWIFI